MMKYKRPLAYILCLILGVFCFYKISATKASYSKIKVHFLSNPNRAVIPVEIEKQTYFLQIDSGSSRGIHLQKKCAENIQEKSFYRQISTADIKGNIYTSEELKIPKIKIENLEYSDVSLNIEDLYFLETGSIAWGNAPKDFPEEGRIGMEVLQLNNLYFEFPYSRFYIAKDFETFVKEKRLSREDFIEVPMGQKRNLVWLEVETDVGLKKFLLDTGASHSLLKTSLIDKSFVYEKRPGHWTYTSQKLIIGNHDFGKFEFFVFDLSSKFGNFDGILGIDFFLEHSIFFDFENRKVLIRTSTPLLSL